MGKTDKFSDERFLEILEENIGIVIKVARLMG